MLAWGGFLRYGFEEEAERLAYKWLYMITKAFVDFNGIVVEKYDVTRPIDPHKVDAEYGSELYLELWLATMPSADKRELC